MSSAHRLAGALDVGEAERLEPLGGRLLAEGARARQRLEERPEPHPLVDRAHLGAVRGAGRGRAASVGPAVRVAPVAERPGRGGAARSRSAGTVWVCRSSSSWRRVLDPAQEPVGVGQGVGVVAVDVPAAGAAPSSASSVPAPQLGVDPAVHELEELGGELDVADAAGAALHVALARPRGGGPPPRPAPSAPGRGAGRRRRTARPTRPPRAAADHRAPSSGSPATGAALSSAWRSHGVGPPLPVGLVRVDAADERAVAALRRRSASTRKHRPARSRSGPAGALEPLRIALADEQEVDVAGVVELAAAELAHPDHREAVVVRAPSGRGRARRARTSVARSDRASDDLLEVERADEVRARDPEQLASLPPDQVVDRRRRAAGRSAAARSSAAGRSRPGPRAGCRPRLRLAASTATTRAASAPSGVERSRGGRVGRPTTGRARRARGRGRPSARRARPHPSRSRPPLQSRLRAVGDRHVR